jgi:hypothetical protein
MSQLISSESLDLFHGSLGLIGETIEIRSGSGVGWNMLTLGNAFYTSLDLDAAMLFSHLVLQKSRLMGGEAYENLGFAKVYQIKLNKDIRILDADTALDASSVRGILLRAGVSERYLKFRNDDQLTDFTKVADLLCYGTNWDGNRNEYLTKALGFDGLMIKEKAWESWDYYPKDIGVKWDKLDNPVAWPPKTVAIYNDQMVSGFELFRDGRINDVELDYFDHQLSR